MLSEGLDFLPEKGKGERGWRLVLVGGEDKGRFGDGGGRWRLLRKRRKHNLIRKKDSVKFKYW